MKQLLTGQTEEAQAKAEAELVQAETEVRQGRARQTADIALARVELEQAEDEYDRTTRLAATKAVATEEELVKIRGARHVGCERSSRMHSCRWTTARSR